MKKLLSLALLAMMATAALAEGASYLHQLFQCDGGSYSYHINYSDSSAVIIVSVTSDNLSFPPEPMLMLKTFDGHVLRLTGTPLGTDKSTSSTIVTSQYTAVQTQEIISQALFPITEEQVNLLALGVAKVRINLLPCVHEREFKKDKIGQPLYYDYYQQKNTYLNF